MLVRAAVVIFVLALLWLCLGCGSSTVRPVDPRGVAEEHCQPGAIDPEALQAGRMRPSEGVRAPRYWTIRDANRDCRNRLFETAEQNRRAAEANQLAAKQSWWDGIQWGAIGVLLLEVLIYVVAL